MTLQNPAGTVLSSNALLTVVEPVNITQQPPASTNAGQNFITSVQATEACLARIKVWQPRTNAFLRLHTEKALAQARAMDKELAAGKRRGPLHGVPMAHKDMYYRKGELSTGGSEIRRNWVAPVTAIAMRMTH